MLRNTMIAALTAFSVAGCAAGGEGGTTAQLSGLRDLDGVVVALPASLPASAFAGEADDQGEAASERIYAAPYVGATPTSHPRARVVNTAEALEALRSGSAAFVYVGEGVGETGEAPLIPGSYWWPSAGVESSAETGAAEPLSGEALQARIGAELLESTGGKPVIFYSCCNAVRLSYNAALRAARTYAAGETLWYRGGSDAWNAAGLPLSVTTTPDWF